MKETLKKWIETTIEIMYIIRGKTPERTMDATVIAPEDIVDYLKENDVFEKRGRSTVFRYQGNGWSALLRVRSEKSTSSKLTIKIVR